MSEHPKPPSSPRRIAASRANGKKSKGPVTPEGKARSAANATRHGLASVNLAGASVCLKNESKAEFIQLHEALIAEFQPASAAQHLLVEEMATVRWRMQRAWFLESALMDNEVDFLADDIEKTYEVMDEATRTALAFRSLTEESPALNALHRYESRLSRQFDRNLRRLRHLQQNQQPQPQSPKLPIEPNPKIEHPFDPPSHPQPEPPAGLSQQQPEPQQQLQQLLQQQEKPAATPRHPQTPSSTSLRRPTPPRLWHHRPSPKSFHNPLAR